MFETDSVSIEIWIKSDKCHRVECIPIYWPMNGQLTMSRGCLHHIEVCGILPKVQAVVKSTLIIRSCNTLLQVFYLSERIWNTLNEFF